MSEQKTLASRVDALDRQIAQIATITEQNAKAIEALIHVTDRRYETIEKRLNNIERLQNEMLLQLSEQDRKIVNMATKEDITTTENRILQAIQQTQRPPSE